MLFPQIWCRGGFIRPGLFGVFLTVSINRTPALVKETGFPFFMRTDPPVLLTTNDYSLSTILTWVTG